MAQYRIRATGDIKTTSEIRNMYPNTSFPQEWDETVTEGLEIDQIFEGAYPELIPPYQELVYSGVEQIDGKWYTKHVLGPVFTDTTDEEGNVTTAADNEAAYKAVKDAEQAKSVRITRGDKLKDSDWTQVADAPVDQAAWAAYRQALRDVTAQSGFPWAVTWPTIPV